MFQLPSLTRTYRCLMAKLLLGQCMTSVYILYIIHLCIYYIIVLYMYTTCCTPYFLTKKYVYHVDLWLGYILHYICIYISDVVELFSPLFYITVRTFVVSVFVMRMYKTTVRSICMSTLWKRECHQILQIKIVSQSWLPSIRCTVSCWNPATFRLLF